MSQVLARIDRAMRRVMPRSKERYFSAEKWDSQWSSGYDLNKTQEDARYATLMALMRRYEGEGPLLDVGCGDGLLEERYRQFSQIEVVAFDYSAAAIEQANARQLPGVSFLCADSRTFRPSRKFSMVVLNESLYYVDDYLGLMKTLSDSLASQGVILVSMHEGAIPNRIWKNLLRTHAMVHGVAIHDESTGARWHIRALRSIQAQR
jgi:trans-aconitate methyltransferase